MQLSDGFLDKWEHIINEVNKTNIPLECVKKVIIKLEGRKRRTINLHALRKQGLDINEIEIMLTRILDDLGDVVYDLDFVVDALSVAEMAQPETDKLLQTLKNKQT